SAAGQLAPFALAKHLKKSLIPARTLLDQCLYRLRRFFPRHDLRVVRDSHTCACGGKPHPDLAVLGQTVRIPPAGPAQQRGSGEYGIPAQRNEPLIGVKMQSRPEPEVVLEAVAQ